MDELFEKMRDLISSKLDIDKEKITMDSSFRGDLATDSLDTYELCAMHTILSSLKKNSVGEE